MKIKIRNPFKKPKRHGPPGSGDFVGMVPGLDKATELLEK